MDFKTATDRLTRTVTLADIAKAAGVSANAIRRARLETAEARKPPAGWQAVVAQLARARARELDALARQLEIKR